MAMTLYNGFDFRFSLDVSMDYDTISLRIETQHRLVPGSAGFYLLITFDPVDIEYIELKLCDLTSDRILEQYTYRDSGLVFWGVQNIRVIMHDKFITVYAANRWLYTFASAYVFYVDDPEYFIYSEVAMAFEQINRVQLDDWREAIFIEPESTAFNAIGSIIQERPIEVIGRSDGSVDFFYTPDVHSEITLDGSVVRDHDVTSEQPSVASDVVVYGTDVMAIVDEKAARDYGFSSRVLRVPSLDSGVIRAARTKLKKDRQAQTIHSVVARFHPAIEVDDQLNVGYTAPVSQDVADGCIVENIRYRLEAGQNEMAIEGRSAFDDYSSIIRST